MNVIRCFTQRNALLIKMKVSNRRKRYDVLRNTASAEMEGIMDQTTRLILAAVVGMILLLVLIIKFKIHAMLSILIFFIFSPPLSVLLIPLHLKRNININFRHIKYRFCSASALIILSRMASSASSNIWRIIPAKRLAM